MKLFRIRYRITTDVYLGYQVEFRYWWVPFYIQVDRANTWGSLELAKAYLKKCKGRVVWEE